MSGKGSHVYNSQMKRAALALAVLFVSCLPTKGGFDTGNSLLAICHRPGDSPEMLCLGTIIGHYDMMEAWGFKCQAPREVTKGQVRDIVLKYLRQNPERRHLPAAFLSIFAIETAFGCRPPAGLSKLK